MIPVTWPASVAQVARDTRPALAPLTRKDEWYAARMATMNRKLYEALRSIGIEDQHAADVSEALSEDIVELKSDVKLLKWIVGFNLVVSLALLWLVPQILLSLS